MQGKTRTEVVAQRSNISAYYKEQVLLISALLSPAGVWRELGTPASSKVQSTSSRDTCFAAAPRSLCSCAHGVHWVCFMPHFRHPGPFLRFGRTRYFRMRRLDVFISILALRPLLDTSQSRPLSVACASTTGLGVAHPRRYLH